MADDVKVTDGIEQLVLDEFICVTQPFGIQDSILVHHDGVLETAAQRQSLITHELDVLHEAKGTRTRHFTDDIAFSAKSIVTWVPV